MQKMKIRVPKGYRLVEKNNVVKMVPCRRWPWKLLLLLAIFGAAFFASGAITSSVSNYSREWIESRIEARQEVRRRLLQWVVSSSKMGEDQAGQIVDAVGYSAERYGVDPLLALAVIKVESGFDPTAMSTVGALGLMQVMPRWHPEKVAAIGGVLNLYDPRTNIDVGVRILAEYSGWGVPLERTLLRYNGGMPTYPGRVLKEREKLQHVVTTE